MKLVYEETQQPVQVGDRVTVRGDTVEVSYFREPHKASSSGKVSVKVSNSSDAYIAEYYVGVIGAEWIDREDRR